jgi:hypothetical protein
MLLWYEINIILYRTTENGTKRYNCVRGSSELRIKIRKPFNLKIWKQKSVQFGFMIRPLINPLNICWTFGIDTLIHTITIILNRRCFTQITPSYSTEWNDLTQNLNVTFSLIFFWLNLRINNISNLRILALNRFANIILYTKSKCSIK